MDFRIFTIVVIVAVLSTIKGQTYDEAKLLRADLLSDYHHDIMPLNNQSHRMQLNLTFILYGMPEVDGVKGVIHVVAGIQTVWIDERISWNHVDYGGISKIPILMDEVWTPSLALGTPAKFYIFGSPQLHVMFFPNGEAHYFPGAILESSCRFNMKFWPFDKQVCDIGFFTLDYGHDQMFFSINGVNTESFAPNEEWTLEETEYYTGVITGFSMAFFRLKFKRQSLFYILTIILPINGIIGLTCLVFLLPSEAGERISYAVTIMLSLAVFMMVVSDEIPKSSEPISLMCCYVLAGIVVSIVSTVAAILNLALYHRNERVPKGAWYISLVRLLHCRGRKVEEEPDESNNIKESKKTGPVKQLEIRSNSIKTDPVYDFREMANSDITWKDVSLAVDKLVLLGIIVLGYIPSVCFLIYLATTSDYQM